MCVIVCVHMLILASVLISMSTSVFEEVPQCMNVSVSGNMCSCVSTRAYASVNVRVLVYSEYVSQCV